DEHRGADDDLEGHARRAARAAGAVVAASEQEADGRARQRVRREPGVERRGAAGRHGQVARAGRLVQVPDVVLHRGSRALVAARGQRGGAVGGVRRVEGEGAVRDRARGGAF
ncbi:MAG: hypothetical protein ACK55I_04875, partial [bacterium]